MATLQAQRTKWHPAPSLVIILAVTAIALLGGMFTDTTTSWYAELNKPAFQPPGWLFGPVWTSIYILLALSAIITWHTTSGATRSRLMTLYAVNGALNLLWTVIFFQARSPFWAGVEIIVLWGTIVAIMAGVRHISTVAALMLLPYLLWVAFASVLTWAIVAIN